jgi:phosphatidylserine decarboxylase
MGTTAGFTVFQDPKVNAQVSLKWVDGSARADEWDQMKKILNVWGEFLSSPDSAVVLGTDKEGWFGPTGVSSLEQVANDAAGTSYKFDEMFHGDPNDKHHGYVSWDDFFTRLFKDGIRPVAGEDDDNIVANCCESKVYKVARNVEARDKFWVKGQVSPTSAGEQRGDTLKPYSVLDMLAFDDMAEQFVGGTVYQAFLSALSYHRWHSPVSGTVKKAYVVDGTYFSEPMYEDFTSTQAADPHGETTSQEYISAVATRAITFIEADNPKIGLMAFIGVGMTEVSTCDITVKAGTRVKKGQELG